MVPKRQLFRALCTVMVVCYLAPTIQCYNLRKVFRINGQTGITDRATTAPYREGKLFVGNFFEMRRLPSSLPVNGGRTHNSSPSDEFNYRTDSAGWANGPLDYPKALIQCGDDEMKLQASSGASQFELDREMRGPLPLSEIPPYCGYSMHRHALGLVMVVPYDGCNIFKEGGYYILPMRWQGIPIMLLCPELPPLTAVIPTPAPPTPSEPDTALPPNPADLPFQYYQWNPPLMPPLNENPYGQQVVHPQPRIPKEPRAAEPTTSMAMAVPATALPTMVTATIVAPTTAMPTMARPTEPIKKPPMWNFRQYPQYYASQLQSPFFFPRQTMVQTTATGRTIPSEPASTPPSAPPPPGQGPVFQRAPQFYHLFAKHPYFFAVPLQNTMAPPTKV